MEKNDIIQMWEGVFVKVVRKDDSLLLFLHIKTGFLHIKQQFICRNECG